MRQLSRLEIFGISFFVMSSIAFIFFTGYSMYMEGRAASAEAAIESMPKTLLIHMDGAVNNPGVYELPLGSRISDAIDCAGGYIDTANISLLNLAETLQDGQKIYVPAEGEISEVPIISQSETLKELKGDRAVKFPINLNTATPDQLEYLPGIGETRAQDIIEYRKRNGGFKKKSELMNVKGIGEITYEKIKDLIYI